MSFSTNEAQTQHQSEFPLWTDMTSSFQLDVMGFSDYTFQNVL